MKRAGLSSNDVPSRDAYWGEVMGGLELPTPCPIMRGEAEPGTGYDRVLHQLTSEKTGAFLDFAAVNKTLTAGGTYRASIRSREIVFRIDPGAKAHGVPIIGRLLRFPPAS